MVVHGTRWWVELAVPTSCIYLPLSPGTYRARVPRHLRVLFLVYIVCKRYIRSPVEYNAENWILFVSKLAEETWQDVVCSYAPNRPFCVIYTINRFDTYVCYFYNTVNRPESRSFLAFFIISIHWGLIYEETDERKETRTLMKDKELSDLHELTPTGISTICNIHIISYLWKHLRFERLNWLRIFIIACNEDVSSGNFFGTVCTSPRRRLIEISESGNHLNSGGTCANVKI